MRGLLRSDDVSGGAGGEEDWRHKTEVSFDLLTLLGDGSKFIQELFTPGSQKHTRIDKVRFK